MNSKMTPKERFINVLQTLADEIEREGLEAIDIEDGEMAYILKRAASLLIEWLPEGLL